MPQLALSAVRSRQVPSQLVVPEGQVSPTPLAGDPAPDVEEQLGSKAKTATQLKQKGRKRRMKPILPQTHPQFTDSTS